MTAQKLTIKSQSYTRTAKGFGFKAILALLFSAALMRADLVKAASGSSNVCTPDTDCTVGEFLFDDSYTPIVAGYTCTITTRDQSNNLIHNGALMTMETDGWYHKDFTAPTATGFYRSRVCCTNGTENLCIDKSFEVSDTASSLTTSSIASAVWNYSNKTLSGFGNLAYDIWNYSGRTLTGFGSLVTNIWDSSTRTLTGTTLTSGNLATKTDIDNATNITNVSADLNDVKKTIKENRLLLEKLVNKPIIESFIEEDNQDLTEKLTQSKSIATQVYINNQYIQSKSSNISSKWNTLSEEELMNNLTELDSVIGDESDSGSVNSFFGQVNWLSDSWNWDVLPDVNDQVKAIKKVVAYAKNSLSTSGKTPNTKRELAGLTNYLSILEKMIGDSSDSSSKPTVFGKIKDVEETVLVLDTKNNQVDQYLSSIGDSKNQVKPENVEDLKKSILAINRIPKASAVTESKSFGSTAVAKIKNSLLTLKALISSNKMLLAKGGRTSFSNFWLEEGSMVFKSMITNPSTLVSQSVPIKYYLPPEVREEDIIEVDEGLKVQYDTEKDQYYIEGEFELEPAETKVFAVRVEDIWVISDNEIDSLRKQAEELSKPLEGTAFFAQGVTLTSDINVSLDKINNLQATAQTPEQKIRNYREAVIELQAVTEKMDKLKELVTQAGSTGTLFGFVGGAQAIAVWGLIIIMATGFVFLALYMRMISGRKKKKLSQDHVQEVEPENKKKATQPEKKRGGFKGLLRTALPLMIVAVTSSFTTALILRYVPAASNTPAVSDQEVTKTKEEVAQTANQEESVGGVEFVRLKSDSEADIQVRNLPDTDGEILFDVKNDEQVVKVSEDGDWVEIALADGSEKSGWIENKYIVTSNASEESEEKVADAEPIEIKITETPTGWLRVRSQPDGVEVAKVNPGDSYSVISEKDDWYQIEYDKDLLGWVSKSYTSMSTN
ncbi:MAG TPA: SH3 domain-containing protein [Patescibacteria group bacterium]|nr:SH3 domain-containing protein [Patescibacteria group bacterium]